MRKLVLLVACLIACGDDGIHHLPDAPNVVNIDAPPATVDGAIQPVTLTIKSDGMPIMGIRVYFQNADSSVVSSTMTDASGVASALMTQPGGFVTAVNPFASAQLPLVAGFSHLKTFAGVKAGDHLVLDTSTALVPPVNFTVVIPEDVGSSSYSVYTTCGSIAVAGSAGSGSASGPPPTATTLYGCPTTIDVVVISYDINGLVSKVIVQPSVALTEGATVTITGAYQPLTAMTFDYANIPATFTALQMQYQQVTPRGFLQVNDQYAGPPVTTAASMVTMNVAQLADALGIESIHPSGNPGLGNHFVVRWGPTTTAHTLDLATRPLVDFTSLSGFDVSTSSILWVPATSGATPDLQAARIYASRTETQADGGVGYQDWDWEIATPYVSGEVKYPVLPAEAATFNPIATDYMRVDSLLTAKVPGGYDTVRANAFGVDVQNLSSVAVGPAGELAYADCYTSADLARTSRTSTTRPLWNVKPSDHARAH